MLKYMFKVHERGFVLLKQENTLFFILILSLAFLFWTVGAFTDFPLNDDWVHALSVKRLIETGRFELIDYCGSTILFQVFWGALFCVFGFSFTALRVSTLVLAAIGLFVLYRMLFEKSKNKVLSVFVIFMIATSPMFFTLAGTFMTDIPFLSLTIISLFFYHRAISRQQMKWVFVACLFSVLATMVRQIGLVLPFCFIVPFAVQRNSSYRLLLSSVMSFLLVFFSLKLFLFFLGQKGMLPSAFSGGDVVLRNLLSDRVWQVAVHRLGYIFFYLGLFTLPISILAINIDIKKNNVIAIALSILSLSLIVNVFDELPAGNVLNDFYIGPTTLTDVFILGVNNIHYTLSEKILFAIKSISIIGIVMFWFCLVEGFKVLYKKGDSCLQSFNLGVIMYCIIYVAFLLVANSFFERYLLPVLMSAFMLLNITSRPKIGWGWRLVSSVVFCGGFLCYTIFGFHDYLALNKARWAATDWLLNTKKVAANKIDGGYEFNGWHNYSENIQNYDGSSWWWAKDVDYIITQGKLPGTTVVKKIPFYCWIDRDMSFIHVLKKKPLAERKMDLVFSKDLVLDRSSELYIADCSRGDLLSVSCNSIGNFESLRLEFKVGDNVFKSLIPKVISGGLEFELFIGNNFPTKDEVVLQFKNYGDLEIQLENVKVFKSNFE